MVGLSLRLRRFAASLVALALLLPGPLGATMPCAACPPDCPMHEVVAAEAEPELPCHRMASPDAHADPATHDDEVVIRASCGRDVVGHVVGEVKLRPPAPGLRLSGVLQILPARADFRPVSPSKDVPTDPPRALHRF